MHYNFCISELLSIMWNGTMRKRELLLEILTLKASSWLNMFNTPCCVFPHLHIITTSSMPNLTLALFLKTLSQAKLLCHLLPSFNLISFSMTAGSTAKHKWEGEDGKNKKGETNQWQTRVGGLERLCFSSASMCCQFIMQLLTYGWVPHRCNHSCEKPTNFCKHYLACTSLHTRLCSNKLFPVMTTSTFCKGPLYTFTH